MTEDPAPYGAQENAPGGIAPAERDIRRVFETAKGALAKALADLGGAGAAGAITVDTMYLVPGRTMRLAARAAAPGGADYSGPREHVTATVNLLRDRPRTLRSVHASARDVGPLVAEIERRVAGEAELLVREAADDAARLRELRGGA